ncbi:YgcG family protein [Halalkalibacter sp. APA_J-10(15)]|uniref:TPM domain-containing protein n=1 Tax=Halalkalibacter sp. APA_J-10(15) TaxID=2933805 RepID=UPI001FF1630F|nr:TPM domain-containing protein [Halalkalibacter sp. APA_J-10(15)]MCK0472283.1 TPM domain-containing protein [Halalkalibacter sp. APA_J-10(15)]
MKRSFLIVISIVLLFMFIPLYPIFAETEQKLYDFAELLNNEEAAQIEALADQYSDKNEVDILIVTTNDTEGKGVTRYADDFYDEHSPGYNQPNGDTALLTVDLEGRELQIQGYYRTEEYIDDHRATLIREEITPNLSDGNYFDSFSMYIELVDRYLNIEPDSDYEEATFFSAWWFHLIVSLGVAGLVVFIMAYNAGGRKTTNDKTYLDANSLGVTHRKDRFVRKSVTKTKKPSKNNSSGGGGRTAGGHSRSGSRGSF